MKQQHTICLRNGKKIPLLGFGTFDSSGQLSESIVEEALSMGYRFFDTSFCPGNEKVLGKVINGWIQDGKLKREEVFVCTKLPMIGMRPYRVNEFLRMSLTSLQMDYVDAYVVPFPCGFKMSDHDTLVPIDNNGNVSIDYDTNIEAVWTAMEEELRRGRTMSIGVYNFNQQQLSYLEKHCETAPEILMTELNVHCQEQGLREYCSQRNIVVIGRAPLGSLDPENTSIKAELVEHPVIKKLAAKYSVAEEIILLKYLIQLDVVALPICYDAPKLKRNLEVFKFDMDPQELSELEGLDQEIWQKAKEAHYKGLYPGIENHKEFPWKSSNEMK